MRNLLTYHRNIGILDIALAPLVDNPFNRWRSASKWAEHALHETAMVVSDLPAYAPVRDGRTGLKQPRWTTSGRWSSGWWSTSGYAGASAITHAKTSYGITASTPGS